MLPVGVMPYSLTPNFVTISPSYQRVKEYLQIAT
jgi:hypothetical protein